ncbi:MAG: ferrous iron transport protein B [Clostridia bacterium]|nr:ferrous iron transport protein B [Clostridia bacterium]
MGLTVQSTQKSALKESIITENSKNVIALAGNPNVGKSTVFNALTGLKQHTGNWPGKTVANAVGTFTYENEEYTLVDLPGTYSLMSNSKEEEIARDFICSAKAEAVIVVADATCLERNLNLVLQILEITPKCILCVNLMDEAEKKKIKIDISRLKSILGIPVVGISAARRKGTEPLKKQLKLLKSNNTFTPKYDTVIESSISDIADVIKDTFTNINLPPRFLAIKLLCGDKSIINSLQNFTNCDLTKNSSVKDVLESEKSKLADVGITESNLTDKIVCSIIAEAENIAKECVTVQNDEYALSDIRTDRILTSKIWGIPIMLCMLGLIFYLSIAGANYPSSLLSQLFNNIEQHLLNFFANINAPQWITNILVSGMYRTLTWVIAVMLPPMAIFFPLFTLLEDLGYLPRVAFNLDGIFKKCCAHGKQCLTMCMGLGCNAAGVTGARIIDSPRERLIAIITNSLVPCNGRFPTLITISAIFIGSPFVYAGKYAMAAIAVLAIVVTGICATFAVSYILSKTVLKGTPSQFTLELPPFRKPKIAEVIYRSVFDRTLFVLGRAAAVAAPAGALIWLTANVHIGELSILQHMGTFLEPFAKLLGLDGYILLSFILGIPANEIVMPILIMCYTASGQLAELGTLADTGALLIANGWNIITAINVMLFSLFHFPCATTLLTIRKETGSFKWTAVSFIIPTFIGIVVCFIIAQVSKIFI